MANDVQEVTSMRHPGTSYSLRSILLRSREALIATALVCSYPIDLTSLHAAEAEVGATILSTSPDGKFVLQRKKADSNDHGEAKKSLEIVTSSGQVLYAWTSPLGATTALWSPDSQYLALNDMPGDKGDQLRLFALNAGSLSLTPIREPDGKILLAEVEARHGSFLSLVDKVSLRAVDWRGGRLWCQLEGTFRPKRQPTLKVPFHHLWVFQLNGPNPPLFQQEWTLTDPKEKPIREIER
jgi:hypothetical protein